MLLPLSPMAVAMLTAAAHKEHEQLSRLYDELTELGDVELQRLVTTLLGVILNMVDRLGEAHDLPPEEIVASVARMVARFNIGLEDIP